MYFQRVVWKFWARTKQTLAHGSLLFLWPPCKISFFHLPCLVFNEFWRSGLSHGHLHYVSHSNKLLCQRACCPASAPIAAVICACCDVTVYRKLKLMQTSNGPVWLNSFSQKLFVFQTSLRHTVYICRIQYFTSRIWMAVGARTARIRQRFVMMNNVTTAKASKFSRMYHCVLESYSHSLMNITQICPNFSWFSLALCQITMNLSRIQSDLEPKPWPKIYPGSWQKQNRKKSGPTYN